MRYQSLIFGNRNVFDIRLNRGEIGEGRILVAFSSFYIVSITITFLRAIFQSRNEFTIIESKEDRVKGGLQRRRLVDRAPRKGYTAVRRAVINRAYQYVLLRREGIFNNYNVIKEGVFNFFFFFLLFQYLFRSYQSFFFLFILFRTELRVFFKIFSLNIALFLIIGVSKLLLISIRLFLLTLGSSKGRIYTYRRSFIIQSP